MSPRAECSSLRVTRRCAMKTIVLGYDDTEPAKRALAPHRASWPEGVRGEVVVVSVAPSADGGRRRGIGPIDPADPPELHREELAPREGGARRGGHRGRLRGRSRRPGRSDLVGGREAKRRHDRRRNERAGTDLEAPRAQRQRVGSAARALRRPDRALTVTLAARSGHSARVRRGPHGREEGGDHGGHASR